MPVAHEPLVQPVVLAELGEVISERQIRTELALIVAEASVHGVATAMDDASRGEHQVYEPDEHEVARQFIAEVRLLALQRLALSRVVIDGLSEICSDLLVAARRGFTALTPDDAHAPGDLRHIGQFATGPHL